MIFVLHPTYEDWRGMFNFHAFLNGRFGKDCCSSQVTENYGIGRLPFQTAVQQISISEA